MIRVLHVVGEMNRGGTEAMLMTLFRNIDRKKIQFDFMVHTEKECAYDEEIRSLGGRIYRIPKFNGINIIQYTKEWNEFFSEHNEYHLIHGHIGSSAAIYLFIANRYGRFSIAHSHNTKSKIKRWKDILYRIFSFPTRYIAKYFFACSEQAGKDRYGKKIRKSNKFKVLNNAIDTKKFIFNSVVRDKIRQEFNIEDKFVIGHIGRFSFQKNHEFLIDIFSEVTKELDSARLMLVGDGELRLEIQQKIEKLGLEEKVIFTGVRSDIPDLLQAMDVFVFPSHFEGLGIVTIEAQAVGLKVICADTIPKEACITKNLEYVSLKETASVWKEKILKYQNNLARTDVYREVCNMGYDIEENANWLSNFYTSKM